ncbi:GumC family protein [Seohaeicola nanhaiensis]|uniref:GumC family protein n=1 Tax=Seohaeicola nanhaiensis TaxID=1387282 RepID=A0ABV9KD77_9RHOB
MADIRYFLSIFIRRLPYFLLLAATISAISVIVAVSLPPAYVSRTRLIVEASQIPDQLAPSMVQMPGAERLQIIEQRLLTRPNLLDIARNLNVLENQSKLTPDEIVSAMQARTTVRRTAGRDAATLMEISFEARTPQLAAGVLNEYLKLIQQSDISLRQARAGQTLDFFQTEVTRLAKEMQEQSEKILIFKNENLDALPDGLDFSQSQRAAMQERLEETEREIFQLRSQRQQLLTIFKEGAPVGTSTIPATENETLLAKVKSELASALLLYSETNPKVKLLQARVAQLEGAVQAERASVGSASQPGETANPALNLQLAEIDTRISTLENQRQGLEEKIATLTDVIDRTPSNAIQLEEMQRVYKNLEDQSNAAVDRLAQATTGERIEILSRGERISIIEQPAIPNLPTKPNRIKIAGGGTFMGIALGLGLVVLLEFLNRAPRRPEDIIKKLGVWPMAAIPYTRTRRELYVQRSIKVAITLLILVGGPIAVWAVHEFYLPLDLLADKVMNKLGVRW